MYDVNDDERVNNIPIDHDADTNEIQQQNSQLQMNRRFEETYYRGIAMPIQLLNYFVTEN